MSETTPCLFCHPAGAVLGNALALAIPDKFPVSPGHMLLIPRRHVSDWFETTPGERQALFALADEAHALALSAPGVSRASLRPDGFNLGINVGEAAGQTVYHVHLHLIPRYRGDVPNPRGGVRGVIPAKQSY
jgi:diadenosine tetraphosphate (Ap4A) HIT family hydrolase